jgi:hypothetical protein
MEELDPRLKGYHKLIAQLRKDKFSIMSEFKLLEARICLNDVLIGAINTDADAELYKQFQDGFLTFTQFVSNVGLGHMTDADRYYLLDAYVNLDEAQDAHKILDTRKPRNLKEVK